MATNIKTSRLGYSIYVAVALFVVYLLNIAYLKLVIDENLTPVIGGFEGISSINQFILLLIMSAFFVMYIVHRERIENDD